MSKYLDIIPIHTCTGCGACNAICPRQCITMDEDNRGFRIPYINMNECIHCNLCKKTCPVLNVINDEDFFLKPIIALAAKNCNSDVAKQSSSGGIFSVIVDNILGKQGTVYGVAMSEDLHARHIRIDNYNEIDNIRGSKYLHSDSSNIYPLVKADLISGKNVLFSGTPCQIAALRQFLRKDYINLLCVEVICHGVPSSLAFRKYVKALEKRYHSKVVKINFRDKSKGWIQNSISFYFENGKKYSQLGNDNLFMMAYVNNLIVRDCCLNCKFKGFRSGADITLGDMWGIENILPNYDTSTGVSMISINTLKGKSEYEDIKSNLLDCVEVPYEDVKRYNSCISCSVSGNEYREVFLQNLKKSQIIPDLKKYLNINSTSVLKKNYMRLKAKIVSLLVSIKHRF